MILAADIKTIPAEVALDELPASDEQMSKIIGFLDYVLERKDVSVVIRISDEDEWFRWGVPQAILLAASPKGYYMELNYSMEEWQ